MTKKTTKTAKGRQRVADVEEPDEAAIARIEARRPPEARPDFDGRPGMDPLPNPRHERFAQNVAASQPLHEAYTSAGFRGNASNARRLRSDEAVWERIEALKREIGERAVEKVANAIASAAYSKDDAMREAKAVYDMALGLGQTGPAGMAVKLRAQLSGLPLGEASAAPPDPEDKSLRQAADPAVIELWDRARRARPLGIIQGGKTVGVKVTKG